jgi:peptide-methionine (S)-S-oxide reductase
MAVILVLLTASTVKSFSMSMNNVKTFHFGAGCFWAPADKIKSNPGIIKTSVGYCGDDSVKDVPTYESVCGGRTKLVEAVRVEYDADKLSFPDLLALFDEVNTAQWGTKRQYEGVIFTSSNEEKSLAETFLKENKQVVAMVEPMSDTFYTAEKYHQDYWAKWRTRIPILVISLALVGKFGGDMSQTIYNIVCYAFIGFTLLERKFDTNVDKLIVGED